jgi:RNA polymerase sigma-70 factor (ECF subfamily)
VLDASDRNDEVSAAALTSLCESYWRPVYAVIRRHGHDAERAGDLTQAFFARVLEKSYFQQASPARGRFRAFLAASVRHFLSNEIDAERRLKRGGTYRFVPLEVESAESWYQREPRDDLTPEKIFDRRWALLVLERVLGRTREYYARTGRAELFDRLQGFLTGIEDSTYADAAAAVGMAEGAVRVAVHRMRRRFKTLLVEEISNTVASSDEVDAEIRHLLQAVSS